MVRSLSAADEPLLVIGGGSNLLLTQDYQGTVLHSAIKGIEATLDPDGEHVYLRCGSGEVFDEVVSYAVSHGYHGLENLSAIPGEVGASAVQNIGAYGVEAKDVLHEIEAVEIATGKLVVFRQEECDYAYRKSKFKTAWKGRFLITYVTYRLSRDFSPALGLWKYSRCSSSPGYRTTHRTATAQDDLRYSRLKAARPQRIGQRWKFLCQSRSG